MGKKNPFGGGNPNSLYVPMSEVEQEVLARLVAEHGLYVRIVGWGVVHNPRVTFGDLRVSVPIQITFDRPAVPVVVRELTLELRTAEGLLLFRDTKATEYNGHPLLIGAGTNLAMVWDIAVAALDPRLVKAIKPGATGLTSRLQDKDTKQFTLEGNMDLDAEKRRLLHQIRKGEAEVRAYDAQKVQEARKKSGKR